MLKSVKRSVKSSFSLLPYSIQHRARKYHQILFRKSDDLELHDFAHKEHPLDPTDLTSVGFHRLRPWFTEFEIDGKKYGGTNSYVNDCRILDFVEWTKPYGRVLELGSFEGMHTLMLSQQPEITSVLGLEGRQYLIKKAEYIKRIFNVSNISFERSDFEVDRLSKFGRFDFVFCSGVLYHITRPWDLIKNMADVTDNVFLATHVTDDALEFREGYPGSVHREWGYREPLSGLGNHSFWLTPQALELAFNRVGFALEQKRVMPEWPNGTWVNAYFRRHPSK